MKYDNSEVCNMKKTKSLVAMLLATTLVAGAVTPAFAATISTEVRGTNTYVRTDNYEKYVNYPAWIWWQGY